MADHIYTIIWGMGKCTECSEPFHMLFMDDAKSFGSVGAAIVIEASTGRSVERPLGGSMQRMCMPYNSLSEERVIAVRNGVRKGDTTSPKLFTVCLEGAFMRLCWEKSGILL